MNPPAPSALQPFVTNNTEAEQPAPEPKPQAIELKRIDSGKAQGDAILREGLRIQEMPLVADRPILLGIGPEQRPGLFTKPLDSSRNDSADLVETLVHQAIGLGFEVAGVKSEKKREGCLIELKLFLETLGILSQLLPQSAFRQQQGQALCLIHGSSIFSGAGRARRTAPRYRGNLHPAQ